ncbi:M23 family metallopeptidase [Parasphingopyxis sp.]|uniref:M23 family metallopeptidase n=1 Tax=Parasphingopyxis sp. TaxID=1920299 RepID=UPI00261A4828|nr:M23 family metallopeptidase [Parasphingopyxis sp.]
MIKGLVGAALLFLVACVCAIAYVPPGYANGADSAQQGVALAQTDDRSARTGFSLHGVFRQGGLVHGQAPAGTRRLQLGDTEIPMTETGRFLIGFGRDHGPSARLVAFLENGETVSENLTIAATNWPVQHVNVARRGGYSSAAFQRRRAPELAQIVAAREIQSDTNGWQQEFLWPVTGRISGVFGSQRIYRGEPGSYHSGVDIARPTGTRVVSPADGVVVLATETPFTLEGHLLIIDHGMGLNSAFLHLSRIDVEEGDRVERGQNIAAIGSTGRSTGPHLHWGMKWGTERIDPQFLVGPMPRSGAGNR